MVTLRICEIEVSKRLNESVTMRNTVYWKIHSTILEDIHMKSSDAKASKCHLKFSSKMTIFIKLVYLSSVLVTNYF